MQNILFDDRGQVKVQELSNVFFDEYQIYEHDLVFLPPEALKGGYIVQQSQSTTNNRRSANKTPVLAGHLFQLNSSMDSWVLGMILLHCICLDYKKSSTQQDSFEEILNIFLKAKGPSLINFEDKIRAEQLEKDAEEDQDSEYDGAQSQKE